MIDFGSGTGQLAIQLAKTSQEVVAVEPDPEMIEEGKKLCDAHQIKNISWVHSLAEDVKDDLGMFKLATFGASFHWMEQRKLLTSLDRIIEPAGGIAIAGSQSVWLPTEPWEEEIKKIIQMFLGEERRTGTGTFQVAAKTGGKIY